VKAPSRDTLSPRERAEIAKEGERVALRQEGIE
jgi:hypothetical protein